MDKLNRFLAGSSEGSGTGGPVPSTGQVEVAEREAGPQGREARGARAPCTTPGAPRVFDNGEAPIPSTHPVATVAPCYYIYSKIMYCNILQQFWGPKIFSPKKLSAPKNNLAPKLF